MQTGPRRPAPEQVVAPTCDDPTVAGLSEAIGGPVGEHHAPHRWIRPVAVLVLLAALTSALGMAQKADCVADRWSDGSARYSSMCYSDLPYLYTGRGFAELTWPYTADRQEASRYTAMEYPAVISYAAWGTAWAAYALAGAPDLADRADLPTGELFAASGVGREVVLFTALSGVLFALSAMLATWFLAGVDRRRPWDAAGFALSPMLALTGLVNWDMLAVLLVAGALWAWSRGRPVLTGVMIGLGAATKLYPLFLLGGVWVICAHRLFRSRGSAARAPEDTERSGTPLAQIGLTTLYAVVAWLAANAPAYLSSRERWTAFWEFNSDRAADLGSLWLIAEQATGGTIDVAVINAGSWGFFALWCLGVLALGLRAPEPPRLAQLGFLIVAGFLLVNKVYSPQYVLWLLPLAALARPRWRDLLIWQAGELLYFASVWWYLGSYLDPADSSGPVFYWLAIVLRIVAELYLIGLVGRDVLRPTADPARSNRPSQADSAGHSSAVRSNDVAV